MAKPKIKWNEPAFAEIRGEARGMVADSARRIAEAAGDGFDHGVDDWPNAKTKRGKGTERPHGYVVTASVKAMRKNARDNTLLRSLDAGR